MALALEGGLFQFNLESLPEAEMLSGGRHRWGARRRSASASIPDVEAGTHAKITTGAAENKFGIAIGEALDAYAQRAALPGLKVHGVAVHIGSQLMSLAPLEARLRPGRADRRVARRRLHDRRRRPRRRSRRALRPRPRRRRPARPTMAQWSAG